MPELPEVETVRRGLEPLVVGRRVVDAWGHPSAKFAAARDAVGLGVEAVGRRGKYLLVDLDDGRQLVVHLGMTGQLRLRPGPEVDPYVRAWWALDDGAVLELRDVRRFGRVAVVPAGEWGALPTLAAQGPEPWDPALDDGGLWRNLRRSRAAVKTQLLSQRPIAGIGNIYADEALWRAKLHWARPTATLTRPKVRELFAAVTEVMQDALRAGGTSFDALYVNVNGESGYFDRSLAVYGRAGQPCSRCGAPIRRDPFMNRSSYTCPVCQPKPRNAHL